MAATGHGRRAAHERLLARGAEFLTLPVGYGWEIRRSLHDPDGHLIEPSQAKDRPTP